MVEPTNDEQGFQFPDVFELSAMGAKEANLQDELPKLLEEAGMKLISESISWKESSTGKYVSVRISFEAASREEYDRAHELLRSHPEVKWTL